MCSCCRSRREDAGRDCTAACSWFHLRWRRLLLWICNPVVWSLFLDVNRFLCSVFFRYIHHMEFCITCEYLMTPGCDVLAWSVTRKRCWVWSREVSYVTHLRVFCSIACLWYFLIQTSRVFLYGVRSARTVTREGRKTLVTALIFYCTGGFESIKKHNSTSRAPGVIWIERVCLCVCELHTSETGSGSAEYSQAWSDSHSADLLNVILSDAS